MHLTDLLKPIAKLRMSYRGACIAGWATQTQISVNVRLAFLLVVTALPWRGDAQEVYERIWVEGEVNGNPVHFAFDTGASWSALTRQTVQKLKLELAPPQTNYFLCVPGGKRHVDLTKEYTLKVGPIYGPIFFAVLDHPAWAEADFESVLGSYAVPGTPDWTKADFDGVLGWCTVTNCVVSIDAMSGDVSFLGEVPSSATKWSHIAAVPVGTGQLALKIPHGNGTSGLLLVDSASDRGVALPPRAWRKWRKAHPKTRLTLGDEETPSDGFYIYEEAWTDTISFGPITFNNVPIEQAGPSGPEGLGSEYEGTIGLAALKRMELVVDPRHDVAYWRLRKSTYSTYSYNRLGAVFCPTSKQPNKEVAHVIKGSPAYAAGVRNGDALLEVDGVSVSSSDDWWSHFSLPAGTKLRLTLNREGKVFQTTATLTEILQPNHNALQH